MFVNSVHFNHISKTKEVLSKNDLVHKKLYSSGLKFS